MSKLLDCTGRFMPLACYHIKANPTATMQSIACVEDDKPIAVALYDNYNTVSMSVHIWIDDGKVPSREWYAAIFDYPFNQLQLHKIVGSVEGHNSEAIRLDEHFGFVQEARVKNFSPNGDLLIYSMTKEQCRILNSPKWSSVIHKFKRVA